jgi:hypothetical protein
MDESKAQQFNGESAATAAAVAAAAFAASNSISRFDSSLGLLTRKFTNLIQVR